MDNIEYKFVDEFGVVHMGESAKTLLDQKSDEKYLTEDGVVTVDRERWHAAQRYELGEWIQRAPNATDDRNYFHKATFDNYKCLEGLESPTSFIEVGCGPFTNARIILEQFPDIQDITLSDPLANQYMSLHRNCTYRSGAITVGGKERTIKIIPNPIEDLPEDKKYDMVVMINVLEHCFDIPAILEKVNNLLSDDGCLIYADVQFDKEVIDRLSHAKYNAGHPIRIKKEYMDNYLDTNFEAMYSKIIPEVVAGESCEERYFIGKKK